ncbi:L domain-like protein [Dacryopinax primogenitus]|uniref:L domain-like protein n=1 Tax=Dacryopinax primogenitus (strain DJM 731) TaxID=1858805 RepID=M5GG87_DACPD|nr:L domain-like protein [Dacryopinax primogenitus]EJU05058.1 L domain-like protein [Dacryopinax primogenitus]
MPPETPARSRIPAPTGSRIPAPASKVSATPSRLAPPGTTRTVALRTQKSASSLRPPPSPNRATSAKSPSPTPGGTRARAKTPTAGSRPKVSQPDPPSPSLEHGMSKMSVKDQIAQRRAVMRDQTTKSRVVKPMDEEWGDGSGLSGKKDEEDLLGRQSMELPCLPYALFNLHLAMEPSFPPPPPVDHTQKEVKQPAFYDCVDLVSLKARDNSIEGLQAELSYFVSLRLLDLNRNKLSKLPPTFVELINISNLDLAHNAFTSIPPELASLTALISLDMSYNPLTSLENIPKNVANLAVSHCQLTLASLRSLPAGTVQLDVSYNAFGASPLLSGVLEPFSKLNSLTAKSCDLDPNDFQGDGWWLTRLSTVELGGVVKEAWEIEAEQRGTRRRHPTSSTSQDSRSANDVERKSTKEATSTSQEESGAAQTGATESHILDPFFDASKLSLIMPSSRSRPPPPAYIPTNTLPCDVILRHGWIDDLKRLVLSGRNADPLFTLPADNVHAVFSTVEDLMMDDCGLAEISRVQVDSVQNEENTFAVIARLFPRLRSLDLSYNRLPSLQGIRQLLAQRGDAETTGVRELRLKGCGVNNVDELVNLLEDGGVTPSKTNWALRELDLSDNEITKLPPKLGLLPVDILLVDGNLFRIPARRVWEKEGERTQNLLRCAFPVADSFCPPGCTRATFANLHVACVEVALSAWAKHRRQQPPVARLRFFFSCCKHLPKRHTSSNSRPCRLILGLYLVRLLLPSLVSPGKPGSDVA